MSVNVPPTSAPTRAVVCLMLWTPLLTMWRATVLRPLLGAVKAAGGVGQPARQMVRERGAHQDRDTWARRRSATGSPRLARAASARTGQDRRRAGAGRAGSRGRARRAHQPPLSSNNTRLALTSTAAPQSGANAARTWSSIDRRDHRRRPATRPGRATARCAGRSCRRCSAASATPPRAPRRPARPPRPNSATLSCGR